MPRPFAPHREAVLDAWSAGEAVSGIARRLGLSGQQVNSAVIYARRTGDARAARHGWRPSTGAPKAAHREPILDAWASEPDTTAAAIGRRLGVSTEAVATIIQRARVAGDTRASKRGGPGHGGGRPPSPHRDAVLDAWSSRPDASAASIGASFGLSRNTVNGIVGTARAKGDPRAVFRGKGYQPSRGNA